MKILKINISKLGYLGNNLFISTLVVFSPLIFILLLNISSEIFSTIDDFDTLNDSRCEYLKFQISDDVQNTTDDISYVNENLNIFPKVNNLKCIGKLMTLRNDFKTVYFIGTSELAYDLIKLVINSFLILNLFFTNQTKYIIRSFINFLTFNVVLNYFFNQEINDLSFLYNYSLNPILENLFIYNIYLIVFVSKINNNYLKIFTFFYMAFFLIDYLPFLFLFEYVTNKNKNNFIVNKTSFQVLTISFYLSRLIGGLFSELNNLWIRTGQGIYAGFSRYDDLRKNIFASWCLENNGEGCIMDSGKPFLPGGGILERYMPFNGDVLLLTKILGSITLILVIGTYIYLIKKYESNYFIITFLFLSPPMNYLIFLLNVDLIILFIALGCLINYKKTPIFSSFVIFILSLYKLHPMGLLLGLAVFALKGRDRKIFSVNILLLIISFATFFIDKIVNNYETAGAVYRIQTYGILNSANVFSFYTSGSQSMFYIIFLIFFALLVFSKLLDKTYSEIKYENFINNYLIYSLIFWFVPTIFYTNHVYRLPLFFILFFNLFIYSKRNLQVIIFCAISFLPAINVGNLFLQNTLITISNICIYIIVAILIKYVVREDLNLFISRIKDSNQPLG